MTAQFNRQQQLNGAGEDVILRVENLKKHFIVGRKGVVKREPITVKAVDGVSFNVNKGETFGIVGESGSGKSTIAYITMGMYLPTSGTIYFGERDLFDKRNQRAIDLKKEIQIVFQDPGSSLNPRRTIKQILELPLRASTNRKKIACAKSSACWIWSISRGITCTNTPANSAVANGKSSPSPGHWRPTPPSSSSMNRLPRSTSLYRAKSSIC